MRRVPATNENPLHWVGFCKRDFLSFPAAVKEDMGNALEAVSRSSAVPHRRPSLGKARSGRT